MRVYNDADTPSTLKGKNYCKSSIDKSCILRFAHTSPPVVVVVVVDCAVSTRYHMGTLYWCSTFGVIVLWFPHSGFGGISYSASSLVVVLSSACWRYLAIRCQLFGA